MQIGNLEPEAAETRSKEVGAESKLSRERFEKWFGEPLLDGFKQDHTGMYYSREARRAWEIWQAAEKDTREQCSQEVTELIKLAASVVRREYLPNLERCRTIRDARDEISRHDSRHVDLGMKIKAVAARLRGGI